MNKTTSHCFHWVAAAASCGALAFAVCALPLATGCASTGSSGRSDGTSGTELRGVLVLPGTNAPAGVVAVLLSRSGTRMPCNLRASDGGVAGDIRIFAARGVVVIVTGAPDAEGFTATSIRADGKPRPQGHVSDDDFSTEKTESIWPTFTWGGVPTR